MRLIILYYFYRGKNKVLPVLVCACKFTAKGRKVSMVLCLKSLYERVHLFSTVHHNGRRAVLPRAFLKKSFCLGKLSPVPWNLGYQAIAYFKNPASVACQAWMTLREVVGGQPHPHPQRRAFLSNRCKQERNHWWKTNGAGIYTHTSGMLMYQASSPPSRRQGTWVQLTELESRQEIWVGVYFLSSFIQLPSLSWIPY